MKNWKLLSEPMLCDVSAAVKNLIKVRKPIWTGLMTHPEHLPRFTRSRLSR